MSNKRRATRRPAKRDADDVLDVRLGREDAPGGDVAVMRDGDGSAYLMPRALRDLDRDQAAAARRLQDVADALAVGRDHLEAAVHRARSLGLSWDSIGWCIGLTGAAVRKRFGGES